MKKIDLHIHTKSNKKGDGTKRNIKPEDFIKKMIENKICICSITNHNNFDLDEFNYINENKEDNFLIFPGIEIDVIFNKNNETKHIILICDPDISKKFQKVFSDDKKRDYDKFNLSYNDLLLKIKEFRHDQIIIIPHFLDKDKNRSISEEEKNKFKEDLKDYQFILEPRLITMGIINSHNELSLIGSDVKDWENYSNDASKLPEIRFSSIKNFSQFYELVSDSKTFIKNFINKTEKIYIPLEGNKKITIYNDINLIFGGKGSGKTYLIKEKIAPYIENEGKNYIFVEGKDYIEKYKKILEENQNKVNPIEDNDKDFLESSLKDIFTYQEKNIKENFYKYVKAKKDQKFSNNISLIKKKDSIFYTYDKQITNSSINDFFGKANNEINDLFQKIDNVVDIIDEYNFEKERPNITLHLKELKMKIYNTKFKAICHNFSFNSTTKFLDSLKSIIKKKSGKEIIPTSLSFYKLVQDRSIFLENINNVKNKFLSLEKSFNFKLGNLPYKGDVFHKISVIVLNENKKCGKPFDKNNFSANRELIKKINNFSFLDFKKINIYFSNDEKGTTTSSFIDQIVRKDSTINTKSGDFYEPSEGEKSILSIINILDNSSYDFYFFDEMERGLGNEYISQTIIPKFKELRDLGKTLIISTHNANIAINTLPINSIFCNYKNEKTKSDIYLEGNMYENKLRSIEYNDNNSYAEYEWESVAIKHLEGSEKMFRMRENIWKEKQ